MSGRTPGPLALDQDPLKTLKGMVKPFRDSIVHASPFSAQARFGGYDKLSKIYQLTLETVSMTVELAVDAIGRIHGFLNGEGDLPRWMPPRGDDGRFDTEDLVRHVAASSRMT